MIKKEQLSRMSQREFLLYQAELTRRLRMNYIWGIIHGSIISTIVFIVFMSTIEFV